MSHVIVQKPKLIARVRRIKGQIEAIERALQMDAECADLLQQVAAIRGAVSGLTLELMEEHIRSHVIDPDRDPDTQKAKGAQELIDVLRTYLK